ncbi:alpha-ketoglutarate-dependent dioxygenase AlkB [Aquimarina sp. U1-2]|uniref:alpha-ketoglutarate-dependent dioxygenase AlkB family protein n=1 Tax=Aquimarina sp. U1-2 TaxID=2823141 RepID=UPI001AEC973D|nr:alpha-ketoglutarate-dependent dioxygenase AlkB [Aquimarina sp. U1-2]MBP2832247.1 alpha-ketoglutarate-dependent dioxygenase AlkB [Aquimarina sp. U1-2]
MNLDLFPSHDSPITLPMIDAEVTYFPQFFDHTTATQLFEALQSSIAWQQDDITIFGKTYPQPRLTALYANNSNTYRYSNITMYPKTFTEELLYIKNAIQNASAVTFTSCLLNLYRDGNDSNGWHADNEKELGTQPIIASVSFGEDRWFHFKHKTNKALKQKILLQHGSLLLMRGKTQECWLHQIPKTKKKVGPRINLTFRIIR